jgi:hypothetical protein
VGSRSWSVSAVRSDVAGHGGDVPMTAYAYCGKTAGGGIRTKTSAATTSPADVYLSAKTATCPKRRRATGGGFSAPYSQSGPTREATFVTRLERAGRAWVAFGVAQGTSGLTLNLTAVALCR